MSNDEDDDQAVKDPGRHMLTTLALFRSQMRTEVDELRIRLDKETQRAGDDLRDSIKQIVGPLQEEIARLGHATQQWQETQARSLRWHTRLRWSWASVLALCLLSLVANYEMIYGYYHQRIATLAAQADMVDAVNHADIVACGDGRLCARIDGKAPRGGDKNPYRMIAPRPSR